MKVIFLAMIRVCVQILIIILTVAFFAMLDAVLFDSGIYYESHTPIVIIRIITFIALSFVLAVNKLHFLAASFLLFVALFDYLLNLFRGFDLFYLGNVADWDVFWTGKEVELMILKVICGLVGVLLLIRDDED